MPDRQQYPPGVPCWVDTSQADPEAAMSFYGGLFGWEFEDRMPPDSPQRYVVARLGGRDVGAIGSQVEDALPRPVWNTYIAVADAGVNAAKAKQAGGAVIDEPFDVGDAGRMGVVADPTGAVFCTWETKTFAGAQAVNEPGSWNWSNLNTRDVERSRAFYGEVFGWEADTVDFGGGATGTMLRLPGYSDSLELIDPGIRERHRDGGAPEGFSDCVAWIVEMSDEQFPADVPPHWDVTFSVDDADAIAGRAAELGGKVLVPPYDAGPVRAAMLSDPQGAVFAINKYDPRD